MTFPTTCLIVPLGALIAGAILVGGAPGETVRQGALQVSFGGSVEPRTLPRSGATPISVAIRGRVRALAGDRSQPARRPRPARAPRANR